MELMAHCQPAPNLRMSGAISLLLTYTFTMRTDIIFFKYLFIFMVYLISLSVVQIMRCQMMEQLLDNKLERMWIVLQ